MLKSSLLLQPNLYMLSPTFCLVDAKVLLFDKRIELPLLGLR